MDDSNSAVRETARAHYHEFMRRIRVLATESQFNMLKNSFETIPLHCRAPFVYRASKYATEARRDELWTEMANATTLLEGYSVIDGLNLIDDAMKEEAIAAFGNAKYDDAIATIRAGKAGGGREFDKELGVLLENHHNDANVGSYSDYIARTDDVEALLRLVRIRCDFQEREQFDRGVNSVPRKYLKRVLAGIADAADSHNHLAFRDYLRVFGQWATGLKDIRESEFAQQLSQEHMHAFERHFYNLKYDDMMLLKRLASEGKDRASFDGIIQNILASDGESTTKFDRDGAIAAKASSMQFIKATACEVKARITRYANSIGYGRHLDQPIRSIPTERRLGLMIPAWTAARDEDETTFRSQLDTLVMWSEGMETISDLASLDSTHLSLLNRYYYRMGQNDITSLVQAANYAESTVLPSGQKNVSEMIADLCRGIEMREAGVGVISKVATTTELTQLQECAGGVPIEWLKRTVHPVALAAKSSDGAAFKAAFEKFRQREAGKTLIDRLTMLSDQDRDLLRRRYYRIPIDEIAAIASVADHAMPPDDIHAAFRKAFENVMQRASRPINDEIERLTSIYKRRKCAVRKMGRLPRSEDMNGAQAIRDLVLALESIFSDCGMDYCGETQDEITVRCAFNDVMRCLSESGFSSRGMDKLTLSVMYASIHTYLLEYLQNVDVDELRHRFVALTEAHSNLVEYEPDAGLPVSLYVIKHQSVHHRIAEDGTGENENEQDEHDTMFILAPPYIDVGEVESVLSVLSQRHGCVSLNTQTEIESHIQVH